MKTLLRTFVLLTAIGFPAALLAQETGTASLLVLSKRDHTLAIVDPATLKVVARVPVGDDPHEVIASSDGKTAYVSNYGFGALHTLAVVDLVTHKALPAIDLGALNGPHGLTFVGGRVWFTAEGAKAFGRYDPATAKIDLVLGTGQNRTHMIYVSPDEQHIVTTNVSSATLTLVDREEVRMGPPPGPPGGRGPASSGPGGPPPGTSGPPPSRKDWTETVVKVGAGSEGFDVSPDGSEIWVANAQDGTISIINRASKTVVATLPVNAHGANRLKITPDGKLALVSMLDGGGLLVMDTHTRKELKRIDIGHGAAGIVLQPDGARAYVSCGPDNYVAVIDLATLTMVGKIDAGGEPDGLAWAVRQ